MSSSLTLPVKTAFVLSWTLKDSAGVAINNADMVATLYAGRSLRDPDGIPGTAVVPISDLSLPYVTSSAGLYSVNVPGTLDPPLDGVGYVLVVDATVSSAPVYHVEQPVVIETAGDTVDLTTVVAVKQRAEVSPDSTDDDNEIQAAITGFSTYFLNWSGQGSLNSIISLTENYDGNGNSRMFLRSYPIQTLLAVGVINGGSIYQFPISNGTSWGAFIDTKRKSIGLRGNGGNFSTFPYPQYGPWYGGFNNGPRFPYGVGNIVVQYTAGYNDTPPDLEYAVRCIVAINYKRKGWQDLDQRTATAGGSSSTIRYRGWEWPKEYQCILENYRRMAAIVG